MTVRIRYYAKLKEEAGVSEEIVETSAATIASLWDEASLRHGFTLEARLIKAAQNDEFCEWDAAVAPGQLVVFMPPVAGG